MPLDLAISRMRAASSIDSGSVIAVTVGEQYSSFNGHTLSPMSVTFRLQKAATSTCLERTLSNPSSRISSSAAERAFTSDVNGVKGNLFCFIHVSFQSSKERYEDRIGVFFFSIFSHAKLLTVIGVRALGAERHF